MWHVKGHLISKTIYGLPTSSKKMNGFDLICLPWRVKKQTNQIRPFVFWKKLADHKLLLRLSDLYLDSFFLWQPTTVFWCLVEFEQLWWKICRSLFLLLPHSFTELLDITNGGHEHTFTTFNMHCIAKNSKY